MDNSNEYRCAMCRDVFAKGWSDEEAEIELVVTFGVPTDGCDLVCDDCYATITPVIERKLAKALEDDLLAAMFRPLGKPRQTALRVWGRSFETVEIDDAGNIIEPPPRCCYGTVLHAPNCKSWGST